MVTFSLPFTNDGSNPSTFSTFLHSFELLGQAQRDLTPEQAAKRLADCSEVHYKIKKT